MKKIACVFIELEDNETVEDVISKIENNNVSDKIIANVLSEAESDWRVNLKQILNDLGEHISSKGYGVMFDIMECVEQNPEYKEYFLLKELYAYVTKKTGRPYYQLERNIRAMIDRIYSKNSIDKICKLLGASAVSCGKISNLEFIAIMIDKIF